MDENIEFVISSYPILSHEYTQIVIGVILWEITSILSISRISFRKFLSNTGRSMIWGGMVIAIDDELVRFLEFQSGFDLYIDWYYYVVIGFAIDLIRSNLTKEKKADV